MMNTVDSNITALFNEIYNSTNRKTLAYITAKCGNISDSGDILQETYLELYKTLVDKGEDYIENPEAFIINIAKQKIYRHFTVIQRMKSDMSLSVLTREEEQLIFNDDFADINVEDELCTNETVAEIERIIATKSQEIRKIFFLRFSLDMTIPDIATLMGLKESSVKNKLYRTISEIRKLYAEEGEEI